MQLLARENAGRSPVSKRGTYYSCISERGIIVINGLVEKSPSLRSSIPQLFEMIRYVYRRDALTVRTLGSVIAVTPIDVHMPGTDNDLSVLYEIAEDMQYRMPFSGCWIYIDSARVRLLVPFVAEMYFPTIIERKMRFALTDEFLMIPPPDNYSRTIEETYYHDCRKKVRLNSIEVSTMQEAVRSEMRNTIIRYRDDAISAIKGDFSSMKLFSNPNAQLRFAEDVITNVLQYANGACSYINITSLDTDELMAKHKNIRYL